MAQYQSSLTGPEIDAALTDMARHDSEAWAVGTRDGEAVSSLDITYHNNAEYYATKADAAAARAESAVPAGTAGAVFFDQAQTLTDAQKTQVQSNIGAYGVGAPNILDNGWFLVNQRQVSTVSVSGSNIAPFVDRWKILQNLSATKNADGTITLQPIASGNTYFIQDFPSGTFKVGDRITISLLVNGVIYSRNLSFRDSVGFSVLQPSLSNVSICPYNTGTVDRISIRLNGGTSQSVTITAIKAEWTPVSTLALDGPPDYASELLRCQRYLFIINSRTGTTLSQVGPAIRWSSSGQYRVTFPLPVPLRATPTLDIDDVSALKLYYQSGTAYACTSWTSTNVNTLNFVTITVTCASISSSAVVAQFAVQAGHALIVSAEV